MNGKHTPEPWYEGHSSSGQGIVISELTGATVAVTYDERDASRIVACINACKGIPTEALENGVIGEMVEAMEEVEEAYGCECLDSEPEPHCAMCNLRAVLAKVSQ